ncbi:MAG: hypothetical protein ACOCX5_06265, partial [Chloroflexota bacterium]
MVEAPVVKAEYPFPILLIDSFLVAGLSAAHVYHTTDRSRGQNRIDVVDAEGKVAGLKIAVLPLLME